MVIDIHSKIAKKFIAGFAFSFCLMVATAVLSKRHVAVEVPNGIEIPIIMYHSILKDSKRAGKYIVSPQTFEDDLLLLKKNGYTTVLIRDLVNYVHNDTPLPEKPIVITLDDGYYNNMAYVIPILEKYNMKAVISVVGIFTDRFTEKDDHNPNYSHVTWGDISQMGNMESIEIANHTYNMHTIENRKGCAIKKGESKEDYQNILYEDLEKLQSAIVQKSGLEPPVTFTYPYGYISEESVEVIKKMGFKASLSCMEKVSIINKNPDCLYSLGRFNRESNVSTTDFIKRVTNKR